MWQIPLFGQFGKWTGVWKSWKNIRCGLSEKLKKTLVRSLNTIWISSLNQINKYTFPQLHANVPMNISPPPLPSYSQFIDVYSASTTLDRSSQASATITSNLMSQKTRREVLCVLDCNSPQTVTFALASECLFWW